MTPAEARDLEHILATIDRTLPNMAPVLRKLIGPHVSEASVTLERANMADVAIDSIPRDRLESVLVAASTISPILMPCDARFVVMRFDDWTRLSDLAMAAMGPAVKMAPVSDDSPLPSPVERAEQKRDRTDRNAEASRKRMRGLGKGEATKRIEQLVAKGMNALDIHDTVTREGLKRPSGGMLTLQDVYARIHQAKARTAKPTGATQ